MPRKEKKYHVIYKTTCKVNSKFYVGMHSTDDLDDGYLGSGKRLWNSIRKHGKENFEVEFLEFFDNRKDLIDREIEMVNEDLIKDPMCMNITIGGSGGYKFNKLTEERKIEIQQIRSQAGGLAREKNISNEKKFEICSSGGKKSVEMKVGLHGTNNKRFEGKTHSDETKDKIRKSVGDTQTGEKNSQFGTCWINNGTNSKRIKRIDLNMFLSDSWTLGMGDDIKNKIRSKLMNDE